MFTTHWRNDTIFELTYTPSRQSACCKTSPGNTKSEFELRDVANRGYCIQKYNIIIIYASRLYADIIHTSPCVLLLPVLFILIVVFFISIRKRITIMFNARKRRKRLDRWHLFRKILLQDSIVFLYMIFIIFFFFL